MKTLLTNIKALLKAELAYVKAVEILPDLHVFPETTGFPLIGILDDGEELIGKEKGARIERLRIGIGLYQAIARPEASVIGDGRNKGLLEIADDVADALRNNSFSGAYTIPFFKGKSKTAAIETSDYKGFVAFKTMYVEYKREVVEAT